MAGVDNNPDPCPKCGNPSRLFTPNAQRVPYAMPRRYEEAWQCTTCGHLTFLVPRSDTVLGCDDASALTLRTSKGQGLCMTKRQDTPSSLDFEFDPSSPSKRSDQFVVLLKRTLIQEFPKALEIIDIWHEPGNSLVSVRNLEKLDEQPAKDFVLRAREVFNDFMSSPWY